MERCTGTMSQDGFARKFQGMQCRAPLGPGGNGIKQTVYPYGTMDNMKYKPSGSSSVGRQPWDGWRYGANYIGDNPGKVYGEPDYRYYRQNYCGPCGCDGCAPAGYVGDPNGQNPNIRYIQLDYNSLLGSGHAHQDIRQSQTSQCVLGQGPQCQAPTSCGKPHCTQCSGVTKRNHQPVKFQVCLGDPSCPETMPPCPEADVKVYVPNQMLPQCQKEGAQENGGSGDDGSCSASVNGDENGNETTNKKENANSPRDIMYDENCKPKPEPPKRQDYEIQIPGMPDCSTQGNCSGGGGSQQLKNNKNNIYLKPARRDVWEVVDPCGSCSACKTTTDVKPGPCFVVRSSKLRNHPCGPCCPKPAECRVNGQTYVTNGPLLCNVKKPNRPNPKLRKKM